MAYSINAVPAKVIGMRIKEYREKLHLSQAELGLLIHPDTGRERGKNTLQLYETGKTYPSVPVIYKLCDIFECEPGDLLRKE